jgi:DNA-binding CsgD family transcriptional regulator/PAS domain-containing protein
MGNLTTDTFSHLVGMIYAAAADPHKWPTFLNQFGTLMKSGGTILFMHDFADSRFVVEGVPGVVAEATGFDPQFVDSYASYYSSKNVWTALEENMTSGTAVVSEMLLPERELMRSEFYGDWLQPQDLRHAIGGVVLKTGTQAMKFTSLRSSRHGAFSQAELAFYAALMPHLQLACKINQQFATLRQANEAGAKALDALPMAVWMCSRNFTVLSCNRAAQLIIDSQRGLCITLAGKLRAEQSRCDALLQQALKLAISANIEAKKSTLRDANSSVIDRDESDDSYSCYSSRINIARICSHSPLAVTVSPLKRDMRMMSLADNEAELVVFAIDPEHHEKHRREATIQALQSRYSLTKHQARLAAAIINGTDLRTYAMQHRISYETARTHLKQVLAKTGTNRQADLIRLFYIS